MIHDRKPGKQKLQLQTHVRVAGKIEGICHRNALRNVCVRFFSSLNRSLVLHGGTSKRTH